MLKRTLSGSKSITKWATAVAALALAAGGAGADTILSVDFNARINSAPITQSPTEAPDFVAFDGTSTGGNSAGQLVSTTYAVNSPSVASNSITVRVAGAGTTDANGDLVGAGTALLSFNNRTSLADSGAFTYADLYRDFVYNSTSNSTQTFVQITGLNPNTAYGFTFYAYDRGSTTTAAKTSTFTDLTNGAQLGSPIAYGNGALPTSNEQYSATGTGVTDSAGRISFRDTSSVFAATINGLRISEVPEPATAGLLAIASAALFGRRRRA